MIETGKHLRQLFLEHGYTVKDIQEILGLSWPQAIYRWLKGETLPTVDHLYVLAQIFGIHMEELLVPDSSQRSAEYCLNAGQEKTYCVFAPEYREYVDFSAESFEYQQRQRKRINVYQKKLQYLTSETECHKGAEQGG
ncbi:MAG: helix-turn-helix domain-containing protein [Emergencia sp.]